jgi:hypothetical protein
MAGVILIDSTGGGGAGLVVCSVCPIPYAQVNNRKLKLNNFFIFFTGLIIKKPHFRKTEQLFSANIMCEF